MKKTIVTLMAMSAVASAATNEPLKDTTTTAADGETLAAGAKGWITGEKYNHSMTIDATNNSITNSDSDWNGDAATYRFSQVLTLAHTEKLEFSFDFTRSASNTVQSLTLVGTTQAVVIGHGNYADNTNLHVGISTNVANATTGEGAHGYVFAGTANQGFIANTSIGATLTGGMPVATSKITGSVAWDGDSYMLTLESSSVNEGTDPLKYDLGTKFDVRDLVFTFDGQNATTLKGLTMSINPIPTQNPDSTIPEPATATLSLLALAGLAVRRRRK